jgi:C4-dicarboxylate transporter DctQ subunit
MDTLIRAARRTGEAVAAALLGALFLTFLLQIFSRYVMAQPFGWTLELCLALWVWLVFFGCAFVVRDRDHVTFDLLYLAAPSRVRRILAAVAALAVAAALAASLPATWDWIDFLRIKRSATLQVPMRTVYAIYAVFLIVVSLRLAWEFVRLARGGAPRDGHDVHVGEDG